MREAQIYIKKTLKKRNKSLSWGGGVVSSLNWGVFTSPMGGCKNITAQRQLRGAELRHLLT